MVHKKMVAPSTGAEDRAYGEDWNKLIDHLTGVSATDPLTLNVNQHNLKDSATNVAGDLLKGNATKYVRFPRGTSGQVLRTNLAGTDLEWATGLWDPAGIETLTNKSLTAPTMTSYIDYNEIADPAAPAVNKGRVFFDNTDEKLKIIKSGGTVVDLEATGGAGTDVLPLPNSFVIYKDGANYKAKNGLTGAIDYTNTDFRTIVKAITDAIPIGGSLSLFFKNGTYLIGNQDADYGWLISDPTDGPSKFLHLRGESRDGVIFQNSFTPAGGYWVIELRTNYLVENITFDGNSLGASHTANMLSSSGSAVRGEIRGCRFKRHTGVGYTPGNVQRGFWCHHNWFDTPAGTQDQMAFEAIDFAFIHNNVFDRTAGTTDGSNLTCGEASNARIHDNVVTRVAGEDGFGISLESWGNYNDCNIYNNQIKGGEIAIGPGGPWDADYTFRNIAVYNNDLQGGIIVQGRPSGGFTNSMKGIMIDNNRIHDAHTFGIYLDKIADNLTVRNNKIRDTNISNTGSSNNGHIEMFDCTNLVVSNNDLRMIDVSNANRNPHGIAAFTCTNGVIEDNHIKNLTANPAWKDWANNTNVKFRGRTGYITEAHGATSVADGGTVAHGLSATPTVVTITPRITGEFASVTARSSTTFTVALKTHANGAGTTQTVDWRASV